MSQFLNKVKAKSTAINITKATLLLFAATTVFGTTAIVTPLATPPAQASWFSDLMSFAPSGIYAKVNGHSYFYGDYVRTGQPQFGESSTWEITYNGQVWMHGYGNTPQWIWSLVNQWFSGQ